MEKHFPEVRTREGKVFSFSTRLTVIPGMDYGGMLACHICWVPFLGEMTLFAFKRSPHQSFFSQAEIFYSWEALRFCYCQVVMLAVLMSKLSAFMTNSFTEV